MWTGVDGGRGAGRGCGWKMKGSEMLVGEMGVDVGGQRPCTKHDSGLF